MCNSAGRVMRICSVQRAQLKKSSSRFRGVGYLHTGGGRLSDAQDQCRSRQGRAARAQSARRGHQRDHRTSVESDDRAVDLDRSENRQRLFSDCQYLEKNIDSVETLRNIPVLGGQPRQSNSQRAAAAQRRRHYARGSIQPRPTTTTFGAVVDLLIASSHPGSRRYSRGGVKAHCKNAQLPKDVHYTFRGSVSAMQKSFSSFGFGLSMAVVLLYLVMVAQFKSFLDPFIIMFAVPMGLIGVVWTLLLTGTTLNIESFMGIVVMVGIVVSNAILVVDFANQRRARARAPRCRRQCFADPDAAHHHDCDGDGGGPDADGAQTGRGIRSLRAARACRRRRARSYQRCSPWCWFLRSTKSSTHGGRSIHEEVFDNDIKSAKSNDRAFRRAGASKQCLRA